MNEELKGNSEAEGEEVEAESSEEEKLSQKSEGRQGGGRTWTGA